MTGPARVLNLLHAAHPDDVPAVLHLLTDAEIAAGLASDLCDPELRSAADRAALLRALLDPRPAIAGLLTEQGRCQAAVRLACRKPFQRILPEGITPFGRPQADVNHLIHTRLAAALGDDWRAWHGVLTRTDMWGASFEDLLAEAEVWGPLPPDSQLAIHYLRSPENLFLPGVLLAMAPPHVVESVLAYTGPRSQDLLEGLLKHAPYHPAYLEHVLGPDGTSRTRQCLAQNTSMPHAATHEFLDRTTDQGVPHLVARAHSDILLRLHAVDVMASAPAADIPWSPSGIGQTTVKQIHALLTAAETAEEFVYLMRRFRPVLTRATDSGPELRLLAYARLARMAGPEAVWAIELDYAHSLDAMLPVVRDSMAANSAAPLYAAAAQIVPPGPPPLPPLQIPLAHWPVEDAVRAHLDHRPERWRALMELAAADPAPVVELVHRLGAESVRQTVRPAGRRIEDLNRTTGLQISPAPAQEGDAL